jgi:Flp pilus assembly protein TadG
MGTLVRFVRDLRGAAAVEMALVLPGFLLLAVGAYTLFGMTYATAALQAATETGARYASVQTALNSGTDPGATAVQNYANSVYRGPGIGASFTYTTTGACGSAGNNGHKLTGTGAYHVYYGWGSLPVTINSAACFP